MVSNLMKSWIVLFEMTLFLLFLESPNRNYYLAYVFWDDYYLDEGVQQAFLTSDIGFMMLLGQS